MMSHSVSAQTRVGQIKIGLPQDWSHRHVIFSNSGAVRTRAVGQSDFRLYSRWLSRTSASLRKEGVENPYAIKGRGIVRHPLPPRRARSVDWSVALGAGGEATGMFPAKFSFDVNATPDCVNDFVVYTLDTPGSSTQANVVALNYLYSGTNPSGICNNLAGNGTSAKVMWAYNTGDNSNDPSPALSLDGTKVAFVENSNPPKVHVLTWSANQGTVSVPAVPTAQQMSTVTLTGATGDTASSPYIDYATDEAYVGTNDGWLFKIVNVFGETPALAGAPWPVQAGNTSLTGPVYDSVSGNIFVGSSNGGLYGFSSSGEAMPNSPVTVGNGAALGGIVDSPIVDSFAGVLYAFTGDDNSNALVMQINANTLLPVSQAPIGTRNQARIYGGDFNDPYLTLDNNIIGTTQEWFLYVCGVAAGGGKTPVLYRLGFDQNRSMNSAVDETMVNLSNRNNDECSPLTDLLNGVDRVFLGLKKAQVAEYFDISSSRTPVRSATQVPETGGTSGIIIDNVSTQNQTSSIYFSTLAADASCGNKRCAVKLTQSTLQ